MHAEDLFSSLPLASLAGAFVGLVACGISGMENGVGGLAG